MGYDTILLQETHPLERTHPLVDISKGIKLPLEYNFYLYIGNVRSPITYAIKMISSKFFIYNINNQEYVLYLQS